MKPENGRKFCTEIDNTCTRLLVYFNYGLSDFYHQTTFKDLSTLTYSATQEIFLLETQLVDEQPIIAGTVP
jgi:hypothetical protein